MWKMKTKYLCSVAQPALSVRRRKVKEPSQFLPFLHSFSQFSPIFSWFFPLFPILGNFFTVKGDTLPPLPLPPLTMLLPLLLLTITVKTSISSKFKILQHCFKVVNPILPQEILHFVWIGWKAIIDADLYSFKFHIKWFKGSQLGAFSHRI